MSKDSLLGMLTMLEFYVEYAYHCERSEAKYAFANFYNEDGNYDDSLREMMYDRPAFDHSGIRYTPIVKPELILKLIKRDSFLLSRSISSAVSVRVTASFLQSLYRIKKLSIVKRILASMFRSAKGYFTQDELRVCKINNQRAYNFKSNIVTDPERLFPGEEDLKTFTLYWNVYLDFECKKNLYRANNKNFDLNLVIDFRKLDRKANLAFSYVFSYFNCQNRETYFRGTGNIQPHFNPKYIIDNIINYDSEDQLFSLVKEGQNYEINLHKFKAWAQNNLLEEKKVRSLTYRQETYYKIKYNFKGVKGKYAIFPLRDKQAVRNLKIDVMSSFDSFGFVYEKIIIRATNYKVITDTFPKHSRSMTLYSAQKDLKASVSKMKEIDRDYSDQQKSIIWGDENNLTIGRSGTGKTQSCVYHLLCVEMLAKGYKIKFRNKKEKLCRDNLEERKKYSSS